MRKKIFIWLTLLCFITTATGKDLLALSPVSYKDLLGSYEKTHMPDETIFSLHDEIKTVIDNLLEPGISQDSTYAVDKEYLIQYVYNITTFVKPQFFNTAHRTTSSPLAHITFCMMGHMLGLPIFFVLFPKLAIAATAYVMIEFFLEFLTKGGNLKNFPSFLIQFPAFMNVSFQVSLFFFLFGVFMRIDLILFLIIYLLLARNILRQAFNTKTAALKYLIDAVIRNVKDASDEEYLKINSMQAIYLADWNKLYLRNDITRDYFQKIISFLLMEEILPLGKVIDHVPVNMGRLMSSIPYENVHYFYDMIRNRDSNDSNLWVRESNKNENRNSAPSDIRYSLVFEHIIKHPHAPKDHLEPPCADALKPGITKSPEAISQDQSM